MKLNEIIKGNFGPGGSDGIEIPKGYDSFYTKPTGKGKATAIIGVKGDTETQISVTSSPELAASLAKHYNSGGQAHTGLKPMTMTQAFGSSGLNVIANLGYKMTEKPDSFKYLRNNGNGISELDLKKIKNGLKEANIELLEYDALDLLDIDVDDEGGVCDDDKNFSPLVDAIRPLQDTCIIEFDTGRRYLIDSTGARSYYRMWLYIDEGITD